MLLKSRRSFIASALSFLFALSIIALPLQANADQTQTRVDFSLRSIDGTTVSSEDVRGQVVVLVFGASWLPLSRKTAPGVRKLADQYSSHGVVVYWVSTESESSRSKNFASDQQLREFANRNGLNVTVLRDPEGEVSKQFGVDQLPAIVILDRQGQISGEPIGGLDPTVNLADQLAPRLNKLINH